MSSEVCLFFYRGIEGVSWRWNYLLNPWGWRKPYRLVMCFFIRLEMLGLWLIVSSFHIGCCGIVYLVILLLDLLSVSILLLYFIPRLVWLIYIEDRIGRPGALLRVFGTMLGGIFESFGQSMIWGRSGWRDMSILFHCTLPFYCVQAITCYFIAPFRTFNLRLISSTMYTTWNIPDSSLLYASWSLGCPGLVKEAEIRCLAYSASLIISASEPQSSL